MQYVGETFLFPVVNGRSLAAPTTTKYQDFYPCNGATLPVAIDRWGYLSALAHVLGADMDVRSPTLQLPALTPPAPDLAWFIASTGLFPAGRLFPDDQMPLLGQISVFPSSPFGREYAHDELLPCDGRIVDARSHEALAYLLGSTFGGDGTRTFGLPNIAAPGPGVFFGMCTNGAFPELVPYPSEATG
jgi:hypothetical protein